MSWRAIKSDSQECKGQYFWQFDAFYPKQSSTSIKKDIGFVPSFYIPITDLGNRISYIIIQMFEKGHFATNHNMMNLKTNFSIGEDGWSNPQAEKWFSNTVSFARKFGVTEDSLDEERYKFYFEFLAFSFSRVDIKKEGNSLEPIYSVIYPREKMHLERLENGEFKRKKKREDIEESKEERKDCT